jgi:hypothetical protein
MEKLKEQIPDLIDSYEELERELGLDLNTDLLEAAATMAEITGDWTEFNRLKEEADKKVKDKEKDVNESAARSSGQLMAVDGKKESGHIKDNKYINNMGGVGADEKAANDALQQALKDRGIKYTGGNNNTEATVDLANPTEMVNYYEALVEARNELQKSGETESDTYRELTADIEEMAEAYTTAKEEADAYLDSIAEEFELEAKNNYSHINTLAKYRETKDAMAETLAKAEGISKAEAENIIKTSEAFKELESLNNLLPKIQSDTGWTEENIISFIDSIPEEDRTILLTMDMTGMS